MYLIIINMLHKFTNGSNGKVDCPYCKGKKSFRTYEPVDGSDVLNKDGDLCGKCDHINSCGVWIKPNGQATTPQTPTPQRPDPIILEMSEQQKEHYKACLKNTESNFHAFCKTLGIPETHLKKWGVGTENDKTVFVFIDSDRKPCNAKYFKYLATGKRDKDFKAYSLKSHEEGLQEYKYKICLFGEHLLSADKSKIVCVVESEKTAEIASYYYQNYDFVSCASASGLTDNKAQILKGCVVAWLCDADKAGRENSSLNTLKRQKIQHKVIDLNPQLQDGTDLADMCINQNFPDLDLLIAKAPFEELTPRPFQSRICRENRLKHLLGLRKMAVSKNPFRKTLSDSDIKDINKLEAYIKVRVLGTNDIYDLEFLALIEKVLFDLKNAYHNETNFNRNAWMLEVLRREQRIEKLISIRKIQTQISNPYRKNLKFNVLNRNRKVNPRKGKESQKANPTRNARATNRPATTNRYA